MGKYFCVGRMKSSGSLWKFKGRAITRCDSRVLRLLFTYVFRAPAKAEDRRSSKSAAYFSSLFFHLETFGDIGLVWDLLIGDLIREGKSEEMNRSKYTSSGKE